MGIKMKLQFSIGKTILKFKLKKYKNSSGKNHSGKTTIFHKGSGHKKRYRQINFEPNINFFGIIFNIEYDPHRNCKIVSVFNFKSKQFFYKIATGCCIHSLNLKFNRLATMTRAAGTYSIILEKTKKFAKILLSSGKIKNLPLNCFATIGVVSNEIFVLIKLGKAGKSRWLNKKPKVRGVAKNPIDHPNGGGEGKKSGNRVSPWGKIMNSFKK